MRYQLRYQSGPRRVAAVVTAGGAAMAFTVAMPAAAQSVSVQPAAAPGTAGARPVLLINGDRLVLRAGGGHATVIPARGSGPVVTLGRGARAVYLPVDALPYLGRGLAPGLFSPASLGRAESGGRLRVRIAFSGRRPRLPGITITQSGAGTARGYLNPRVFGAALARQFAADHARASYGTDGMFAGGVSIAPYGTSPALARSAARAARSTRVARARPDYPMHELTVTCTNQAGRPDNGDEVVVINAADWHTFGDPVEAVSFFYHGVAKYSVPAGTYWAFAWFSGTGKSANTLRMDVLPQFTVRGGHTQVHLAARATTTELATATPRPSVMQGFAFQVTRGGLHGTSQNAGVFGFPGTQLWLNRVATRPSVGSLNVYAQETLFSPAGAPGLPYAYNLMFIGPAGVIPSLRWTVSAASLASVTEHYFQEVPGHGQVYGSSLYPPLGIGVGVPAPVRMPGEQVEYLTANPDVAYQFGYYQFTNFSVGGQGDALFTVRPGQHLTEDWNTGPLHPQPAVQRLSGSLGHLYAVIPTAYRAGNKLTLTPNAFSDNVPGHTGGGYFDYPGSGVKISGHYAVYQNGALIAHGNPVSENPVLGLPAVTLSPRPSVIRFELSAVRRGARFPLSSSSDTVWTWRSAPRSGATLPPTWACGFTGQHCAVQPMMTLNYEVHGLRPDESTASGRQVIGLSVGHIEPGPGIRVTHASMQVSFDGGHTWQPATVTPAGPGQFTVSFTAPAGVQVSLRTSATDAAGGSITETIQDGYRA